MADGRGGGVIERALHSALAARTRFEQRWRMSSDLTELEGIPDGSREMWTGLLNDDLLPVNELFAQVRRYQQSITQASNVNDDVDPGLARSLASAALKLLGTVKEDTPEGHKRAIQAAVRYLIIEDDAESDTDSVIGLDDDTEVLNAVLRHLGHGAWAVAVR